MVESDEQRRIRAKNLLEDMDEYELTKLVLGLSLDTADTLNNLLQGRECGSLELPD